MIGPLGDATRVLRGNYSSPQSAPPVSVVDGLRRALPRRADHAGAVRRRRSPTAIRCRPSALRTPDGKPGLLADYLQRRHAAPRYAPGTRKPMPRRCRRAGRHAASSPTSALAARAAAGRRPSQASSGPASWSRPRPAPTASACRASSGTLTLDGKPVAELDAMRTGASLPDADDGQAGEGPALSDRMSGRGAAASACRPVLEAHLDRRPTPT